jgi:hypothetical protein
MFYFLLSVGALAKFSSFGFAKRWLVCRAKPNVLNVRLAFMSFFCLSMFSTVCLLGLLVTSECEKTQSTIFMVKLVEKGKETM